MPPTPGGHASAPAACGSTCTPRSRTQAGRYVQGGGCTTVGVAGLIQSGGFGSFSKGFGNAASGLLEAEVVTADGRVRIVNACTDAGPVLGAQRRWWRHLRRGHAPDAAHPRAAAVLRRRLGHGQGEVRRRLSPPDRPLRRLLRDEPRQSALGRAGGACSRRQLAEDLDGLPGPEHARQVRALWQPFFDWVAASAEYTVTDELGAGAHSARSRWWEVAGQSQHDPRPARRRLADARLVAGRSGPGGRLSARL